MCGFWIPESDVVGSSGKLSLKSSWVSDSRVQIGCEERLRVCGIKSRRVDCGQVMKPVGESK